MNKIYVEKNYYNDSRTGESKEYKKYYILCENEYNIPSLKVYIDLSKETINLLLAVGALYEEKK